jgi:nucleotide-binding universal stress UspA family protein
MAFKNLFFAAAFDDGPTDPGAAEFAGKMASRSNRRLTAALAAVTLELPGLKVLPMAHAVADLVNDERLNHASTQKAIIEKAASLSGFTVETLLVQKSRRAVIEQFIPLARIADLCVLPRPTGEIGAARALAEALLFNSGRPAVLVPSNHTGDAVFPKVMIAWDGGARAARAVGDASPIILEAERVQIVCVAEESKGAIPPGADLAARLSHDCKGVELVDLPAQGDIGRAIQDQAKLIHADILIMGAYAHARVFELIMGGVTRSLMQESEIPLFMSY